jgi:hypothetical protein
MNLICSQNCKKMNLELKVQEQIGLLNHESLKDLQLFIDFLINKQKQMLPQKPKKTQKRNFLDGMKRIPVPVDNVIIDRSEIYDDDRF